jgi:hypothetical protein
VTHNRAVEGLKAAPDDVERLLGQADLVISFASGGGAGLVSAERMHEMEPLLARSHVSVLSFPDPDSLVGELSVLEKELLREPDLEALRFWVQVVTASNEVEEVGFAQLGKNGDAKDRLWSLLDNARRRPYRVLVEPMSGGLPTGDPLVCPCRAVIQSSLTESAEIVKIVPAGSRLIAVATGSRCR